MHRLLPIALVVALAGMTWFILSRPTDDGQPEAAPATQAAAPPSARPSPLPMLGFEPEPPPAPPTTLDAIQQQGVVGQPSRWLPELMATRPEFKAVAGVDNAWASDRMEVRWRVTANGQVAGAEVLLVEDALGGEVTALSSFFVGNQDALPFTLETDDPAVAAQPAEGTFESSTGETFYFRAEYRTGGDGPYGPKRFEISRQPLQ